MQGWGACMDGDGVRERVGLGLGGGGCNFCTSPLHPGAHLSFLLRLTLNMFNTWLHLALRLPHCALLFCLFGADGSH